MRSTLYCAFVVLFLFICLYDSVLCLFHVFHLRKLVCAHGHDCVSPENGKMRAVAVGMWMWMCMVRMEVACLYGTEYPNGMPV